MSESSDKLWYRVARTIVKAGLMPIPINDTLIELLKTIITEEQAKFILIFKKPSLSIDQIKAETDLDEESLEKMLNELMDNGIVVGVPSRSTGIMVYRLLGPFPGLFEYTNLRGETGEKKRNQAQLFEKLFEQLSEGAQKNYEEIIKQYKNFPPIVRTVPVEEQIEAIPVDKIIPFEEVSKIIDKFDVIALAHCYCRHERDLINDPCKITKDRLNCFLLGKSAQFVIEHKFGTPISKKEAKKIINRASDEGLVHKAFHVHLNLELDEEAICNCCKCCCGIFSLFYRGVSPYHCYTSYLARTNESACIGCETCIKKCPMEAIKLINTIAKVNESRCIGCGICAHFCNEKAIKLERTGNREVFVPPPIIKAK